MEGELLEANGRIRPLKQLLQRNPGRQKLIPSLSSTSRIRRDETKRLKKLDTTVRNLLDNITGRNRELVDRRIEELEREREAIATRIDALDQMALSASDAEHIADEVADFVNKLEQSVRFGDSEQRKGSLRRCITQMTVDPEHRTASITVRCLPGSAGTQGESVECLKLHW